MFAIGTLVGILKANVASAVCTRHSRDAVLWSVDALSQCFPMFWGHLALNTIVLKVLAAREREGSTFVLKCCMAFGHWGGNFKAGTRIFIPATVYFIHNTVYLLLDT